MITTRELSDRLRQLVELRNRLSQEPGDLDRIAVERTADEFDTMRGIVERDMEVRLLNQRAEILRNVHAALDRLRQGTYGVCCDCDEDIPARRLEAVPWAERCARCQEAFEDGRRENAPESFRSHAVAA
jgi:DnaK suppressor protein